MMYFRKRLMPDPQQHSVPNEAERAPVGARARSVNQGKHSDDFSFSWFGTDNADSSIFDNGSLIIDKSENGDTVSHKTLDLEGDSLHSAEEDIGVDPYNTGCFDTAN